jgi:hypothetical protein
MTRLFTQSGYGTSRAPNGDLIVHDVEIFCETERAGKEFDVVWIRQAFEYAMEQQQDGYLPPMHFKHHKTGSDVEFAGKFQIKEVRQIPYKGRNVAALIADLHVHPDVENEVMMGKFPYRSVEIENVDNPRIDGLALLDHEAPYLELPMLMINSPGISPNLAFQSWDVSKDKEDHSKVMCFSKGEEDNKAFVLFDFKSPKQAHFASDDKELASSLAAMYQTNKSAANKIIKAESENFPDDLKERWKDNKLTGADMETIRGVMDQYDEYSGDRRDAKKSLADNIPNKKSAAGLEFEGTDEMKGSAGSTGAEIVHSAMTTSPEKDGSTLGIHELSDGTFDTTITDLDGDTVQTGNHPDLYTARDQGIRTMAQHWLDTQGPDAGKDKKDTGEKQERGFDADDIDEVAGALESLYDLDEDVATKMAESGIGDLDDETLSVLLDGDLDILTDENMTDLDGMVGRHNPATGERLHDKDEPEEETDKGPGAGSEGAYMDPDHMVAPGEEAQASSVIASLQQEILDAGGDPSGMDLMTEHIVNAENNGAEFIMTMPEGTLSERVNELGAQVFDSRFENVIPDEVWEDDGESYDALIEAWDSASESATSIDGDAAGASEETDEETDEKDKTPKKDGPGVRHGEDGRFLPGNMEKGTMKPERRQKIADAIARWQKMRFEKDEPEETFKDESEGEGISDVADTLVKTEDTSTEDDSSATATAETISAIENGTISIDDFDAIEAAMAARRQATTNQPTQAQPQLAVAASPSGEMMQKNRRKSGISNREAALQGRIEALEAENAASKELQACQEDVDAAFQRLKDRPLGSDLKDRLLSFRKEHGAKAFGAYTDSLAQTAGVLPSTDGAAEFFQSQNVKVDEVAMKYHDQGEEAVERAMSFCKQHEQLSSSGNTSISKERYVELNMKGATHFAKG